MLANIVDPDQTPCSVASDLGIHCLHRSKNGKLDTSGLISLDKHFFSSNNIRWGSQGGYYEPHDSFTHLCLVD